MNKFRQILSANLFLLKRKSVILRRSSGALGDNLMLSFLAREIKKKYPDLLIGIETSRPELFLDNPNIDKIYTEKVASKYYKLQYRIERGISTHILDQLANNYSSTLSEVDHKLELFLNDTEISRVLPGLSEKYIVIAPQGKQSFAANRKEWNFNSFVGLRDIFSEYKFVQVGSESDSLLPNVMDFRGLPVRECAAIIYSSLAGIFLEGGMMHLANAVGKPSVIIYGGALNPKITGYKMHINLSTSPSCSPCFTSSQPMETCETMHCMKEITVDQVAEAVRTLIQNEKIA